MKLSRWAATLMPCLLGTVVFAYIYLSTSQRAFANDNLLAFELFEAGDYAQAAEIFTDPAWKGAALYRSEQWWRAAEAFVRASDPVSAFNLGNCYVKLGYYELALEAYLQALQLEPAFSDAQHNADVIRALLALEKEDQQGSAQQAATGKELEQLETQSENEEGRGESGEDDSDKTDTATQESKDTGERSKRRQEIGDEGDSGQGADEEQTQTDGESGGALSGITSEQSAALQQGGGAESDQPAQDSQAAGERNKMEVEQATVQWLNLITHDAPLFLSRRIELEQRRRQAAGQAAPEGGTTW